jgi:hypothetical protein
MSNSLEDFFNKLAGKDILKEMRDEEQAKIDAKAKLVADQQEKAKVEKEKKQLSESEKLNALEQLFGLPKFDEIAKKEVDKNRPSTLEEKELEETLKVLSTSVEEYQKQKVSELDIDETDYKKYLQSKKPVSEDQLVLQIEQFLNDTYFPPKEEVKPVEEVIDAKYLHKKENVYEPLEPGLVDDVKSFIESKSEPQPYMKMNVGDPIKPSENYVSREDILKTLTKKAKSLKEQLDGGSISIEELTKEFTRFKQLTSLQLQSLGGGGAGDLADLGDVDTSSQADGFALKYNSTTNKYDFGEVASDLSAVSQDIVPDGNGTRSLGSSSKRWKDIFLTGTTINLGGATISSDGTGTVAVSATGVTLPTGSKVGTSNIAQSDADTGIATRSVPLFTASGGLDTAATTFTFAAQSGRGAQVFTAFKKSDGTTAGKFELFTF